MASLPKENIPPLKKSVSGSMAAKSQKSILGFFQRKPAGPLQPQVNGVSTAEPATLPIGSPKKKSVQHASKVAQNLTPAPSSDAIVPDDDEDDVLGPTRKRKSGFGLPSPVTPATVHGSDASPNGASSSPTRKVCRVTLDPQNTD